LLYNFDRSTLREAASGTINHSFGFKVHACAASGGICHMFKRTKPLIAYCPVQPLLRIAGGLGCEAVDLDGLDRQPSWIPSTLIFAKQPIQRSLSVEALPKQPDVLIYCRYDTLRNDSLPCLISTTTKSHTFCMPHPCNDMLQCMAPQ
jgi:hypothetical protein